MECIFAAETARCKYVVIAESFFYCFSCNKCQKGGDIFFSAFVVVEDKCTLTFGQVSARDEDMQLQLFLAAVFTVQFAVANASRPSCNIFCAGGESSYDANRCDAKVVSNLVPCTAYL